MRTLSPRHVLALIAIASLGTTGATQQPIQVTGTDTLVKNASTDGVTASAFSRDGGATWTSLPAPRRTIQWRERTFDPAIGDPGVPPSLMADGDNQLYYVQFVTDLVPAYEQALRQLGADATRYVPHETLLALQRDFDALDGGPLSVADPSDGCAVIVYERESPSTAVAL